MLISFLAAFVVVASPCQGGNCNVQGCKKAESCCQKTETCQRRVRCRVFRRRLLFKRRCNRCVQADTQNAFKTVAWQMQAQQPTQPVQPTQPGLGQYMQPINQNVPRYALPVIPVQPQAGGPVYYGHWRRGLFGRIIFRPKWAIQPGTQVTFY